MNIIPVVLAGGIGERFWPLSRSSMPKQLHALISSKSMLEETCKRADSFAADNSRPLIITGSGIARRIRSALRPGRQVDIIREPVGKNTAPAVALGAAWIEQTYGESLMAVLSADHAISPVSAFAASVRFAASVAKRDDACVIFGIPPTRPDTGYGYIKTSDCLSTRGKLRALKVDEFVEKPDVRHARLYVEKSNFLWNSGMFVWKTSVILEEFKQHMPALFELLQPVIRKRFSTASVNRYYLQAEKQSIDYGILEKSERVVAVAGTFSWDDVGSWEAMARLNNPNAAGTTAVGPMLVESHCRKTILVNKSKRSLVARGLDNVLLVATDDAILAIDRNEIANIKQFLAELKSGKQLPTELF